MILTNYINKRVQIILKNGFTYIGLVIEADFDSLIIIDKTNSKVQLRESLIDFIKEVSSR